jgi:NTE family protein
MAPPVGIFRNRRARAGGKRINLALQGGGAHGAFTWGVLDRLLEDGRLSFDGVSGTSAGALNAVALAVGLTQGGCDGARSKLEEMWRAVSEAARYSPLRPLPFEPKLSDENAEVPVRYIGFDLMTRLFSPYQLNPLDFDPVRELLERTIDFRRLRRSAQVRLFIAATDVATGNARIFGTREISVDAVLASATLPQLHRAVTIGNRHYWDGGYCSNPPILALVRQCRADDTLIVQLNPSRDAELPTTAPDILARLSTIVFNAPLRREMEMIGLARAIAREGFARRGAMTSRLKRHRFHYIEAASVTGKLGPVSKMQPDWELLCYLRDSGRTMAGAWLRKHYEAVGQGSTADLGAKF